MVSLRSATIRQRGLLDSSATTGQSSHLPFQFNTRKWRWWNYVSALVSIIACVELILLVVSMILLALAPDPITFSVQQTYPKIPYQPLDTTMAITLAPDSNVYHVTKEFGPATMGGMGTVLTAMTQAQLRTGKIQPNVVLPFYSFLKKQEQYPIKKTVDLVITFRDDHQQPVNVEFKVSEMQYDFEPISNFNTLPEEDKLAIMAARQTKPKIKVFLIGPGKVEPLRKAFRAGSITQIYSSPKGLPQEWKDQYFTKAAASFLVWRAAGKHEQSLFAPLTSQQPKVDVVHLHGATNAYVAKFLSEYEGQLGAAPPAIIYTMHDYLDELQYTNTLPNVVRFLNTPRQGKDLKQEVQDVLMPYTFGSNKMFMSPMAVDIADTVTFVSQTMAKDMVEGKLDFYLKEVVMENILRKAERGQFYGVSNGVDFDGSVNPFTERKLVEAGLHYSDFARTLINAKLDYANDMADATVATAAKHWSLSAFHADYVTNAKQKAKQFLVDQGLLYAADVDRPLVLYVGRFQYNKGLETFEDAARLFKLHDMKFAIIGQPNNYPLSWVKRLAAGDPENIVLMTHTSEQRKWLIYFRAAADFVYVPSVTESFGLVAAEGLLFGSSVISTGTGGLAEFLVDRQLDSEAPSEIVSEQLVESHYRFNAYLFDALATTGDKQLSQAIMRAATDYERMRGIPALHETYVLRMMLSAYSLGWERAGPEQGPVYDYLRIYQQAIYDRRSKSSFALAGDDLDERR
ncbi:uncharacterized protein ATC70_013319 [Mucor velutinosus]|uniref:Uncharacterized protein n=1 Tax=Mucor velutinosus TaxID=708070 RepID=A0AAN7HY21_9FUNG|nr:hypothetical protein ATC70_013319 [Mucor velutinosus]